MAIPTKIDQISPTIDLVESIDDKLDCINFKGKIILITEINKKIDEPKTYKEVNSNPIYFR